MSRAAAWAGWGLCAFGLVALLGGRQGWGLWVTLAGTACLAVVFVRGAWVLLKGPEHWHTGTAAPSPRLIPKGENRDPFPAGVATA